MIFATVSFIIFLLCLLLLYYIVPVKYRWLVLLLGSAGFYYVNCRDGFWIFIVTIILSWLFGRVLYEKNGISSGKRKAILILAIMATVCPLIMIKEGNFIWTSVMHKSKISLIIPLGISFYTLQIIAYLVDVYRGKYEPEKNLFRYALFLLWFPQIIQGPIPRFERLQKQLLAEHRLDETAFEKGWQMILWGWFLKYLIADKAGVIVDAVFGHTAMYKGCYVLIAGILYSIQLYADFEACVCIAKGISELFGIKLDDNFSHPYYARTVADFWRRWHISLSSWLREYIYIPLGGNRKGTLRKYINILIVFAVSGMWHGAGVKYLFWGLLHGMYQIAGSVTAPLRDGVCRIFRLRPDDILRKGFQTLFTFICVMLAWIIFRAETLQQGVDMIVSVFTVYNPWILWNDKLYQLGLSWKECMVLLSAILLMVGVGYTQRFCCIRDKVLAQNIVTRCVLYLSAIAVITVYGTYGFGFDAKDFIYGGF